MGEAKLGFLFMNIVLLIVFVGFIKLVFDLHRFLFIAEFLFLGVLMLMALVSIVSIYNNIRFGWALMALLLGLVLVNLLFIYLLKSPKSGILLPAAAVGLIGLVISLVNIKGPEEEDSNVKKEFKPGKYIASRTGAKFHSPKCDWAKKIKKSNAVWFDSKEEASKAGYKADDCV